MKYLITSLTFGACLLLPPAEAAFAAQPNASCGSANALSAPGNSVGAVNPAGTNGSPFAADTSTSTFTKGYAGSGSNPTTLPGHPSSSNAVAQYDISCVNVSTKSQGHKTQIP
jgi:hypothetical protein